MQQKNIKAGTRVALLSGNCPDVVFFNLAASIVGCCVTPLHPLGSFEDQAYILNDAEIEVLVFQPSNYEQRASELLTVSSNLKHLLAFGPTEVGVDLSAGGKFDPAPLVPPDVQSKDISNIVYTGGTTTNPKGNAHSLPYVYDDDANGRMGHSFSSSLYGRDTFISRRLYLYGADLA